MTRTVAEKMGIKAGVRAYFDAGDDEAIAAIDLPAIDRKTRLVGEFSYLHLFARTAAILEQRFGTLAGHLAQGGSLWVSWPKGKQLGSDLTLPHVIEIGYRAGLVESKTISLDKRWSGIKFTHPIPGKVYKNSYGTLPEAVAGRTR
jgi:hypothetical protein